MSEPLPTAVRVLLLEDRPDDADLAILELRRAGLEPTWVRVETEEQFVEALSAEPWDVVLADNNLPTFDGISALRRVSELRLDVPFIIVSGSIGEEEAVAAMQSGAADYVLKDRMTRLGQAVRRALDRHLDRRRRADAEARVQQLERLRSGAELATDLVGSLNPQDGLIRILRRLQAAVGAEVGAMLELADDHALVIRELLDPQGRLGRRPGEALKAASLLRAAVRHGGAVRGGGLGSLRHTAAVALAVEDRTVLVAVGRDREAFGDAELETLELIGGVATLAMRNADLFSAAAAASQAKSEFLNMAAHELRTPLSVITGYVSLLHDGSLGAPSDRWLGVVDILAAKAAELSRLVDSLLAAARLESGQFTAKVEELDLVELASQAIRRAEPRAQLLEANVRLDAPAGPVLVQGDAGQVARILDNLVDNALTHGGGRPWVRISVSADGRLEVEDGGPGVPEASRERIFERFYRASDPERTLQAGTGLGLYIARELAEGNGGSLELSPTRLGAGARFVLRLGLSRRAAWSEAPPAVEAPA